MSNQNGRKRSKPYFSNSHLSIFIRIAIFLNNDFILCFIVGLVQSSITFVSFSFSMRAKNVSRLGCLGAERIYEGLYCFSMSNDVSLVFIPNPSTHLRPLSVWNTTTLVPFSSFRFGNTFSMPQKSAIVMSLWLRPFFDWQL